MDEMPFESLCTTSLATVMSPSTLTENNSEQSLDDNTTINAILQLLNEPGILILPPITNPNIITDTNTNTVTNLQFLETEACKDIVALQPAKQLADISIVDSPALVKIHANSAGVFIKNKNNLKLRYTFIVY